MNSLKYFFEPKGVAVIGASRSAGRLGNAIFRNFVDMGREAFPVNPKAEEVLGVKAYPSVDKIPKRVDLAVICTPAETVPGILKQCHEKKVRAAIIISGGFSEVGNRVLEDEVKKLGKEYGIRIIGPNCIGVLDRLNAIDTLFLPAYKLSRPPYGNMAFISQSGAVGSAILDWAATAMHGISRFVSYGNGVDVNEVDLIKYLAEDKDTHVIAVYLESTKDGRKLMEAARKIVPKKPILIIKVGKSEGGKRAVSSHTGNLAGSDKVYDAAFRQCGILRAGTTEQLFDFAQALSKQPAAKGNRVMILTNGGGLGVIATDTVEEERLRLAELEPATVEALRKKLPTYAVVGNPVDLVGDADADRYATALDALTNDRNVDIIVCIVLFQTATLQSEVVEVISNAAKKGKPIIACSSGGDFTEIHRKMLERSGIPTCPTPERAVKAAACLIQRGAYLQKIQAQTTR